MPQHPGKVLTKPTLKKSQTKAKKITGDKTIKGKKGAKKAMTTGHLTGRTKKN